MRTIVNISLPKETAREVKEAAKAGGFATTSEFFRHMLREYQRAELARELRAERDTFKTGTWKRWTPLKSKRK